MSVFESAGSEGAEAPDELVLPLGGSAPYSGVLIPEDAYRFYQEDFFSRKLCEAALQQRPEAPWFSQQNFLLFGAGLLSGFLIERESR